MPERGMKLPPPKRRPPAAPKSASSARWIRSSPRSPPTSSDYVAEIRKPDAERLPGFHEAQLESLRVRLFSPAPLYPAMESARIAGALEQAQAELGPNDAFVKASLN